MLTMYEDTTDDRRITNDPEGTLVLLCEACAAQYGNDLYPMERGTDYGSCEECGKGWQE